jgi:transposase
MPPWRTVYGWFRRWLAVAVVPASTQDRDTLPALDAGKAEWPSLREVILDGAFTAERCREWANLHGMRHRVVVRGEGQKGFVVLARRWVVERSFGWLTHWGGLLRDQAGRLDVAAGRIACVASPVRRRGPNQSKASPLRPDMKLLKQAVRAESDQSGS